VRAILRGKLAIESPYAISSDTGIVVQDGTILKVGNFKKIALQEAGTPVKEFEGIICPGLINAHTHLELSSFGRIPHKDFVDWVLQLMEARLSIEPRDLSLQCTDAKRHAEGSGTAYFVNVGNDYVLNRSFGGNQLLQFEQIGINEERAADIYGRAVASMNPHGGMEDALAIHAPYSVSPSLMKNIKKYNNEHGFVTSIHLAETADEVEFIRSGKGRMTDLLDRRVGNWKFDAPGVSPVEYVDRLGILEEKTICVHCVFIDDKDMKLLGARGSAVASCVRSNRALSGKVTDMRKLLKNGIRVLIGTDSKASSPDIDMFNEVSAFYNEFHDVVTPAQVFEMATSDAAEFLGIDNRYGRISPQKSASLVFVPFDGKPEDAFEFLVTEAHGQTKAIAL